MDSGFDIGRAGVGILQTSRMCYFLPYFKKTKTKNSKFSNDIVRVLIFHFVFLCMGTRLMLLVSYKKKL